MDENISIDSFGRWAKIETNTLDQVVDKVLTGYTTGTIPASKGIFTYIGKPEEEITILDFGSGVGRNAFELSIHFKNAKILCYDSEQMNLAANKFAEEKYNRSASEFSNVSFTSDWEEVKKQKFDCIVAILVFQHIKESDLTLYLKNIKNITKKLIVFGRRLVDEREENGDMKSVWKILEKNDYKPSFCSNQEKYNESAPKDHFTCIYDF
ncbi:MAG: class I SAM-dependent methyltransferase [Candidatus Paceibacterota bacterium]|jgi:2-polyprenyl-3-methyl-5-hydroxy-6-metoxy-1,4-benzoquinol methylase